MLKLRRAQDQVSRSENRPVSLEETLAVVIGFYLHRTDPVERARRVIARKGIAQTPSMETETAGPIKNNSERIASIPGASRASIEEVRPEASSRRPLTAAIKHAVRVRDDGKCQARKPGGGLCGSSRWLDLHHLIPVSRGGSDEVSNLTTLCRACHSRIHHTERESPSVAEVR